MKRRKENKKEKNNPMDPFDDAVMNEPEDNEKYSTDDDELFEEEKKLLKKKPKAKLVSVYELIGKPKKYSKDGNIDKKRYLDLLTLIEKQNVLVHFNNEYSIKEKYEFITNEVFAQFVENDKGKSSKVFVYEDYHPDKYTEIEDDAEFT
ncbi:MAG: hypothetical protein WC139_00820 [Candidatus Kapaibacterium sp.]